MNWGHSHVRGEGIGACDMAVDSAVTSVSQSSTSHEGILFCVQEDFDIPSCRYHSNAAHSLATCVCLDLSCIATRKKE